VDNLFVFLLVFHFFNVAPEVQHKVLFYGILGAIVMRAVFIFSGVELIRLTYLPEFSVGDHVLKVNVLLTIFGLVLIAAGWKSWFASTEDDGEKDFAKSPGARLVHRFFRVSEHFDGDRFFTVENGIRVATPLLVVVAVVEFTDLLFAIDSIPAIFAIAPNDPFILYTSNIFAILGLRSLYFLLANSQDRFARLKYGLALILAFIGVKMVLAPIVHVPSQVSLSVVGALLVGSIVASLLAPRTT
jgi:tellurite resistance protein TerC